MGQNKEQLSKLLDFIDSLANEKGNEWFVDELKKRFGNNSNEFDSFIRLHREKQRKKARAYYKDIKEPVLRNQLIEHHAKMLWYKSISEIEQFFVYVNLQIENMLNFYINQTGAHDKISKNPSSFYKINYIGDYKIDVDCQNFFFNKYTNKENTVDKINSLWAKLLYWAIDSNHYDFYTFQINNLSAIINIRNDQNHANYMKNSKSAKYWKDQEDDYAFAFIYAILKTIRTSII